MAAHLSSPHAKRRRARRAERALTRGWPLVLQESVDLVERAVEAEVEAAARPGVRDYEVWAAAMYAIVP